GVARRRKRIAMPRVSVPRLVQLGLAVGFCAGAAGTVVLCPTQPPYLLLVGVLWGALLGWVMDRIRFRTAKFLAALKGMPLQADDLRALYEVRRAR
ncbi:MAG: hypothetical protein AB1758_22340, partial [Candidatus Eremiobacterota bacterium]